MAFHTPSSLNPAAWSSPLADAGAGRGGQREVALELDLAPEAVGRHLVGQLPLVGLHRGLDLLGRHALDRQVGRRELDGRLDARDVGGDGEA